MSKVKRTLPGPERAPWRNGSLQEWAGYGFGAGEVSDRGEEWRDNEPFAATLWLTDIERGRSAARFTWRRDSTEDTFPMFMTDMLALCQSDEGVRAGIAEGWWIVMKRGSNYGIARYVSKGDA